MKTGVSDLARLKWAIALLVILSACGTAAVWMTLQMQKSSELASRQASAARNEIRTKLARAREEQEELRSRIGRYQAFKASGFIGSEQRLDWVESLAKIKSGRRIQKLDYEFSPQRPADAAILPGGPIAGNHQIMASQMRMQVQFLHEGELLSLIDEIRSTVKAFIQVRSCIVERIKPETVDRNNPVQLSADCTLEWITFLERK